MLPDMHTPGDVSPSPPARDDDVRVAARTFAVSHPEARLHAARLDFACGQVDTALAELGAITEQSPTDRDEAIELGMSYRLAMGRTHEALTLTRIDGHRRAPMLLARMANVALGVADTSTGLALVRRALLLEPRSARLQMAEADALLEMGSGQEAVLAARAAVDLARGDGRYREAAAMLALRAGDFAEAHDLARRVLARSPLSVVANDVVGHLALFRGDAAEALAIADAVAKAGEHATAGTLRGAALWMQSDAAAALAELDSAIQADDGAWEPYGWRAELRYRAGDREGAISDAENAMARGQGLLLSVRVVRALATMGSFDAACCSNLEMSDLAEIAGAAIIVFPEAADDFSSGDRLAVLRWLEKLLEAMKGNRWVVPSYHRNGELLALQFRGGPRYRSRRWLDRVVTSPPDELLGALDDLAREYPGSGLPRCHRGELLLWLGRWEEARADLERVVGEHPQTRWAYVGLAQIAMHDERPDVALATIERGIAQMGGTSTPAVLAMRGEVLLRQGRLEEAATDLKVAVAAFPSRLTSWMSLALVYGALGRSEEARHAVQLVRDRGWPLLHDVARSDNGDPDELPSPQLLEAALRATLGCRSSVLTTWRIDGSPLRALAVNGGMAERLRVLRRTERDAALRALRRLGVLQGAPVQP